MKKDINNEKKKKQRKGNVTDLTENQRLYVDKYFELACDKKAAAIAAGYSPKGIEMVVYRLDHHDIVQAEIMKRERLIRSSKIKKIDSIASDLERNAEEAYQAGKYSDSNRALELLAKLQGAFKESIEVNAHVQKEEISPSPMIEDILSSIMVNIKEKVEDGH